MMHGLVGIILTDQAGRPVFVCRCGGLASGVDGATWAVTQNGHLFTAKVTATLTPSINWPDHFHTPNPATNVRIMTYDDYYNEFVEPVVI